MDKFTKEQQVQAIYDLKVGYTLGHADISMLKSIARQLLAELESRTVNVNLPPRVDSSNVPFTAHTWNCCLDAVEKCLTAAGIQVIEGEGQ